MKRISLVFVLCLGFLLGAVFSPGAFAQSTPVTTATTGIIATVLAILGVAIPLYNVLMSAISQGFAVLHKGEPGWLQTAGTIGLQASKVLTANTNLPPTPVTSVTTPSS